MKWFKNFNFCITCSKSLVSSNGTVDWIFCPNCRSKPRILWKNYKHWFYATAIALQIISNLTFLLTAGKKYFSPRQDTIPTSSWKCCTPVQIKWAKLLAVLQICGEKYRTSRLTFFQYGWRALWVHGSYVYVSGGNWQRQMYCQRVFGVRLMVMYCNCIMCWKFRYISRLFHKLTSCQQTPEERKFIIYKTPSIQFCRKCLVISFFLIFKHVFRVMFAIQKDRWCFVLFVFYKYST